VLKEKGSRGSAASPSGQFLILTPLCHERAEVLQFIENVGFIRNHDQARKLRVVHDAAPAARSIQYLNRPAIGPETDYTRGTQAIGGGIRIQSRSGSEM